MDALCQLDQLARAVRNMRTLQTKNVISPHWVTPTAVAAAEQRVDDLVANVLGGVCAPIPSSVVSQLLEGGTLEEVLPQLPLPDTNPDIELLPLPEPPDLSPPAAELYTRSAEQLRDLFPDLPPPPARELPDLSKLFLPWVPPMEENP